MLTLDERSELCLYTVGDGKLVMHNTKSQQFQEITKHPELASDKKASISQAIWKENQFF